jgi:hypothetical protein
LFPTLRESATTALPDTGREAHHRRAFKFNRISGVLVFSSLGHMHMQITSRLEE